MPRKRMSLEEKRVKLKEIIFEGKCVWNLKELEKVGSKAGIVQQSIKDVLQSLVDDNMVDAEKIGSSNYFWGFSSKLQMKKKSRIRQMESSTESLRIEETALQESIEDLRSSRSHPDRSQKLEQLQNARNELASCQKELDAWKQNDPSVLLEYDEKISKARDGANRWTDNVWCCESYVRKKFNVDSKTFWREIELPDDMDNV